MCFQNLHSQTNSFDRSIAENSSTSLLLVNTLDGYIHAIDLNNEGKLLWNYNAGNKPLISSSLGKAEAIRNGVKIRVIPSLDGKLYQYEEREKRDDNNAGDDHVDRNDLNEEVIRALPFSTSNLLKNSLRFSEDIVLLGGEYVTTFNIDLKTGKPHYVCGLEGCQYFNEPADANKPNYRCPLATDSLLIKRVDRIVRSIDSRLGEERWNFSVGDLELKLLRAKIPFTTPKPPVTLTKPAINFRSDIKNGGFISEDEFEEKLDDITNESWSSTGTTENGDKSDDINESDASVTEYKEDEDETKADDTSKSDEYETPDKNEDGDNIQDGEPGVSKYGLTVHVSEGVITGYGKAGSEKGYAVMWQPKNNVTERPVKWDTSDGGHLDREREWHRSFTCPIAKVWSLIDGKLQSLDLHGNQYVGALKVSQSYLPRGTPIYIGTYQGQLYVQSSIHNFDTSLVDLRGGGRNSGFRYDYNSRNARNIFDRRRNEEDGDAHNNYPVGFPTVYWKPYLATSLSRTPIINTRYSSLDYHYNSDKIDENDVNNLSDIDRESDDIDKVEYKSVADANSDDIIDSASTSALTSFKSYMDYPFDTGYYLWPENQYDPSPKHPAPNKKRYKNSANFDQDARSPGDLDEDDGENRTRPDNYCFSVPQKRRFSPTNKGRKGDPVSENQSKYCFSRNRYRYLFGGKSQLDRKRGKGDARIYSLYTLGDGRYPIWAYWKEIILTSLFITCLLHLFLFSGLELAQKCLPHFLLTYLNFLISRHVKRSGGYYGDNHRSSDGSGSGNRHSSGYYTNNNSLPNSIKSGGGLLELMADSKNEPSLSPGYKEKRDKNKGRLEMLNNNDVGINTTDISNNGAVEPNPKSGRFDSVDSGLHIASRFHTDFQIINSLGKGGFGLVLRVKNKMDDQSYAIKRITLPNNESSREKVLREVKALAKLDHINIVRYFQAWIEPSSNIPLPKSYKKDLAKYNVTTDSKKHLNDSNDKSDADEVFTSFSTTNLSSYSDPYNYSYRIEPVSNLPDSSESSPGVNRDKGDHFKRTDKVSSRISHEPKSKLFLYIQMQLCQRRTLKDWLLHMESSTTSNSTSSHGPSFPYVHFPWSGDNNGSHIRDDFSANTKRKALYIFDQIVQAVQYFHERGLIHRDLKPSNIFFSVEGVVKIGDFGLAVPNLTPASASRHHTLSLNSQTMISLVSSNDDARRNLDANLDNVSGNDSKGRKIDHVDRNGKQYTLRVGTRLYMSPEQVENKVYTNKVDIYSLGLILFELLYPFSTQMERIKTLMQCRQGNFPKDFQTEYPKEFQIVKWLLSQNPDDRPDAKQLKDDSSYKSIFEY
ncbi:unnamed protein product [Gordionus sp. m RMFG-2023]